MEPIKSTTVKTPLDISEIRASVAWYLSLGDAVACSLVCKAWSEDFMPRIWYTFDFGIYKFFDVDPDTISQRGKHIRVVSLLTRDWEAALLQDPCVRNLISIDVEILEPEVSSCVTDLVRRNRNTITELQIDGGLYAGTTTVFDCAGALISSSATLSSITTSGCKFLESRGATFFQHLNVESLDASISQVLDAYSSHPSTSLLIHFPNLKRWSTSKNKRDLSDADADSIQKDLSKYCPGVVSIRSIDSSGYIIQNLLSVIFQSLEDIGFIYEMVTPDVVGSILFHKGTLLRFDFVDIDLDERQRDDEIFDMDDSFSKSGSGWMLQMIPMTCSRLQVLNFSQHEMDMDVVERMPWMCMELKELHVRVRGLNTKGTILAVMERWRLMQKESKKLATSDSTATTEAGNTATETENTASIENRVIRHLLQFKKLTTLWLGYKTWRF
ncbi:hypothetical protein BGX26_008966 [Mortierella sp. AD094]|nr:hypothetical protein BGX26_008966 [Mortierella sp. AD094]